MLGDVAGRGQSSERETSEVDVVAILQSAVGVSRGSRAGGQSLGPPRLQQLPAAGDEVGMEVGLGGEADRQPTALRSRQVGAGVAGSTTRGAAIVQVDEVRGVA